MTTLEGNIFFEWDVVIQEEVFECDSKIVSNAVNNIGEPQIIIAKIIFGIQQKMWVFRMVQVCHVKRQRNWLAHVLAWYAKGVLSYVIWIEENPNIIESALAHDVLNFSSSKWKL